MRRLRALLLLLGGLTGLAAAGVATAWVWTAPEPLPAGSETARRALPGPLRVASRDLEWVDTSRSTPANRAYPGAAERILSSTLWYPEGSAEPHPLVVYSHGFLGSRFAGTFLAEHLASHGYVVISPDFPLSRRTAPGGPTLQDLVHQPGDVSFLIDRVLALADSGAPFVGPVDRDRIGVVGHSLGGLTSTLVAFHPEWRDPRVAVAISLAGPADVLGPAFFDHAEVPFLMIGARQDAVVDYETNAAIIPDRVREGGLLTLHGATHVGFDHQSAGLLRILGDPDQLACRLAPSGGELANPFVGQLGSPDQGLLEPDIYPSPCRSFAERRMASERQQRITLVAVRAFFESYFARDAQARAGHHALLTRTLPSELAEVSYTEARR